MFHFRCMAGLLQRAAELFSSYGLPACLARDPPRKMTQDSPPPAYRSFVMKDVHKECGWDPKQDNEQSVTLRSYVMPKRISLNVTQLGSD